jgi:hypothetical protein
MNSYDENIEIAWSFFSNPKILVKIDKAVKNKRNLCLYTHTFYDFVWRSGMEDTGWYTVDTFDKQKTHDHFLSPRLIFIAAIKNNPKFLSNFSEFKKVFELCRKTIGVTEKQNQDVKYKNNDGKIKISKLTLEKYNDYTFLHKTTGKVSKGNFPLKDIIPDWLTKYEKTCLL